MPFLPYPVAEPFLKWAGGKRWIASSVANLFGNATGRHVEPFAGSAACFFSSSAKEALLGDSNRDLMNAFRVVKDQCDDLVNALCKLEPDIGTYNRVKASHPRTALNRAVRLIYLNRTSFNGLYRVNRRGEFNVPFGCKPGTKLCDPRALCAASSRLKIAKIRTADFARTLALVTDGDCIFIDPPYTVKHNSNCFRRYNETIFSWNDQVRLAKIANNLASQGHRIIIMNALHADVMALYSPRCYIGFDVARPTNMAASPAARGKCHELMLVSSGTCLSVPEVKQRLRAHFAGDVQPVSLG